MWDLVQLYARVATAPGAAPEAEWLVTNGIGGFAAGTVSGRLTRRYHGWLIAALQPPVRRTLLLAKAEEHLQAGDQRWPLSTNEFADVVHPDGWRRIESLRLYPFPTHVFRAGAHVLERVIFMIEGQNTTVVVYRLLAGPPGAELVVEPLINCRDYHHTTQANDWPWAQESWRQGTLVRAYPGAPPLVLAAGTLTGELPAPPRQGSREAGAAYVPGGQWHYRFHYAVERERGLDCTEDHFRPGTFRFALGGPGSVAVLVGHCPLPAARRVPPWREGPRALAQWALHQLARAEARRERLVRQAVEAQWEAAPMGRRRLLAARAGAIRALAVTADPDWRRLVLAADDFIVRRATTGGATIVAGYPWFTDWGRDAFISLPGLLLATGRREEARDVLLTFAQHRSQGLIPNRFPDDGGEPEYNSVDASLWWVAAAWRLWRATREPAARREFYRITSDILRSYLRGTKHGIGVDADGLVHAAAPGLQLTWMDAKVDDWVVTPRHGAPVEVNALWYNALCTAAVWAEACAPGESAFWRRAARQVRRAFLRRFVRGNGLLYDVVPPAAPRVAFGENGELAPKTQRADASLRPNQLLAAALPFPLLDTPLARRVVAAAAAELLTPVGLRTLSPREAAYRGVYKGDQRMRDASYHQGTAWPWLLGPYATAARRCGWLPRGAEGLFAGLRAHLRQEAALGQVSEIFDGDAPHAARGCFAQAWSVGEWLRAWSEAED